MPIYSYEKAGKEHYYYAFEVKDRLGKRKTIKKKGFKGKTECRNAERIAKVEWEKGQYVDPTKITVQEYMLDWIGKKKDLSIESRETNMGHLKNHIFPSLGHLPLQKVLVTDIEDFILAMEEKGLAQGTVKKIFCLVQNAFKAAIRKELLLKNPFDLLDPASKPKEGKPKVDYWSKDEVQTFFSRLDHRLSIMFVLAIYTGMRRGEILGLRFSDIDFENSMISIRQTLKPRKRIKDGGKNANASRSIPLSEFVVAELKKQRTMITKEKWDAKENYHNNDLVVCHPDGEPVSLGNFHKFWVRILNNTNMRHIRFHDLRHTFASLMLSAGVHAKVVQEIMGHSSIKVTLDMYSHLIPSMQRSAVNVLDDILQKAK
ncbi:tyrosine-type recombinase/integrase [Paenibacillus amylolyticus]|uniref:tyrosine-type recombinase/integrase n=1 Tax=Paenibacillus amylolyticus TaxID=1451 RepID=UPI003D9669AD